jgi:hypothetical protein
MELEELDLNTQSDVPKDTSVLVIAGIVSDISDQEKEKIEKYLNNNGNLLVMLSSALQVKASELKNISDILAQYNIGIQDDIVFENSQSNFFVGYPTYIRPELEFNEITEGVIKSKLRILIPETRSLKNLEKEIDGLTLTSIAKTSSDSWGETNFNERAQNDSKDIKGPMDIIFMAEKTISGENPTTSKIIVYGNSLNIMENAYRQLAATGNVELFVSAVKYLSDYAGTINITPKSVVEETVTLTLTKAISVFVIVILLPIFFIICGVWVWIARKRL